MRKKLRKQKWGLELRNAQKLRKQKWSLAGHLISRSVVQLLLSSNGVAGNDNS